MRRPRHMLATVLAVAVTVAGSACACALGGAGEAHDAAAHHAHHGHGAEAGSAAACAHPDCDGDCGVAAAAERDAAPKPLTPPDDAAFVGILPVAAPAMRIPACRAPPPRLWRPADTPVRRFDVLLN